MSDWISAILAILIRSLIGPLTLPNGGLDDSHMCVKREHVGEFHTHINFINPPIKFTIEIELEGYIAFLDTKATRQENGSVKDVMSGINIFEYKLYKKLPIRLVMLKVNQI